MALGNKGTRICVAVTPEGKIVAKGTICLTVDECGIAARIENVICAEEYQRMGLMTEILDNLREFARPWQPYIMHLASHPLRKRAYAFYKNYGFKVSGCGLLIYPL